MSVKIVLADDHKIMRDGLRLLLENQPDLKVVAEAGNGHATLELVKELSPDLVIMDISMADLNGIEATRSILSHRPKTRIIILSMHSDKRFIIEALKAGAFAYLLKDCAFEELITAIKAVLEGKKYLSPRITHIVLEKFIGLLSDGSESSAFSLLTPREREVLQLLAEGKTSRQIAGCLNLSVKTVDSHRQQIMNKLNLHTIAELTKYAVKEGLTSLEINR